MERDKDLLITAPTAGGKTEAVFLPIISWLELEGPQQGYGVLCLSPLKALINDQYNRLESLCERALTEITPWHGDVSQGIKKKSWKNPGGILLITPESLEAMFVKRQNELLSRVSHLAYIVIDEFHAFIGSERGQQLLSLLTRLEVLIGRTIPRIALSATIGCPDMALKFLRPGEEIPGFHLDASAGGMDLQLVLKTLAPKFKKAQSFNHMAAVELFQRLRGSNNLVFANSRRNVEEISDHLGRFCERKQLPAEFFPHHGSLAREDRHYLEDRLSDGNKPTTAIATSTLELGIDIGSVESVAQIGAPANVSSIRQRLGRSGRREEPSKLRLIIQGTGHIQEPSPLDRMEIELFQTVAVIELMFESWIEPPDARRLHLSTLIQQILSMIAYQGDISANQAYNVLCKKGPWQNIDQSMFAMLLRGMGQADLIKQLQSGELVVGLQGERLVSNYEFYTAFKTPQEYRLIAQGRNIGTLPIVSPYTTNQLIIFSGRRWVIISVDEESKTLNLKPASSGQAPKFDGEVAPVHRKIREKMRRLYTDRHRPEFCDETSYKHITEARSYFSKQGLNKTSWVQTGKQIYWFVWESDVVINTIVVILAALKFEVGAVGPVLCIDNASNAENVFQRLLGAVEKLTPTDLTQIVPSDALGKFDEYLPDDLKRFSFATETTSLSKLRDYLNSLKQEKLYY
jgi:ATP-dependent Lhr-like helicase